MTIERIEVWDYKRFGQLVVEWTLNPATRPQDIGAMREALRDIVEIPARVTAIAYLEYDTATMAIRIPNKAMVEESIAKFTKNEGNYPAPAFYRNLLEGEGGMSDLDLLYSRIADYTVAQCR